jgi:hypothetical protein
MTSGRSSNAAHLPGLVAVSAMLLHQPGGGVDRDLWINV